MRAAYALEGPVLMTQPCTGWARESRSATRHRPDRHEPWSTAEPWLACCASTKPRPSSPTVCGSWHVCRKPGADSKQGRWAWPPLVETLTQTRLVGQRTRCPAEPRQLSLLPWGDCGHWEIFILLLYKCQ